MATHHGGKADAEGVKLAGHDFKNLKVLLEALNINNGAADSTQSKCLTKYLDELDTKCCVVEHDYTDADYLADHVGYYARCHDAPPKLTKRLHFFSLPSEEVLAGWSEYVHRSEGASEVRRKLNKAYLGFIVIRPLPVTVIGRTCLKTYPGKDDAKTRRRIYPITREYKVHLYGLPLIVDSVAFQQQDNEIAACATAALWFTMHALPERFTNGEIPSPFAITTDGWENLMLPSLGETARKFPAVGLDVKQMDGCLRAYGLDSLISGASPKHASQLPEYVAAYVQSGYPMIVVGDQFQGDSEKFGYTSRGLHAITVLGHSHRPGFQAGSWSERIERIYAHDDGIGPFASYRMASVSEEDFEEMKKPEPDPESEEAILKALSAAPKPKSDTDVAKGDAVHFLKNESGLEATGRVHSLLIPRYFIIPMQQKVRLPYETVHLVAKQLDDMYKVTAHKNFPPSEPVPQLSWEVRLEEISSFKGRLPEMKWLTNVQRESTLLRPMARFLWTLAFTRESASKTDLPLLMIVFDATALKQSGGISFLIRNEGDSLATTFTLSLSAWFKAYFDNLSKGRGGLTPAAADVVPCLPELFKQLTEVNR